MSSRVVIKHSFIHSLECPAITLKSLTSILSFKGMKDRIAYVLVIELKSGETSVLDTFWAAACKGSMTYAFTHGEISPSSF